MRFCTETHDPQWMNPNDFGDPLTFPHQQIKGSVFQ